MAGLRRLATLLAAVAALAACTCPTDRAGTGCGPYVGAGGGVGSIGP